MARFVVTEGETPTDAKPRYAVVDTDNKDLPVAHFDNREDASAHADKLNEGPLDWDEQEAWQDDDDWGDDENDGGG